MTTLGDALREARLATGLSLRDAAALSGVSPPLLSMIERGSRRPSLETLEALVRVLRVRVTFTPRGVALAHERRTR